MSSKYPTLYVFILQNVLYVLTLQRCCTVLESCTPIVVPHNCAASFYFVARLLLRPMCMVDGERGKCSGLRDHSQTVPGMVTLLIELSAMHSVWLIRHIALVEWACLISLYSYSTASLHDSVCVLRLLLKCVHARDVSWSCWVIIILIQACVCMQIGMIVSRCVLSVVVSLYV